MLVVVVIANRSATWIYKQLVKCFNPIWVHLSAISVVANIFTLSRALFN